MSHPPLTTTESRLADSDCSSDMSDVEAVPTGDHDATQVGPEEVQWPNDNWRLVSKLINACRMSDGDAEMLLKTLKSIDPRLSIPRHIRELRKFERRNIGGGM